jgi:single-stranded-DNA-specific exonuclease
VLVNPKKGGGSFRYLAGAGVAFKLAWGLLETRAGMSLAEIIEEMPELFVLATIGTISDRVPPYCENKAISDTGCSLFAHKPIPFVDALRNVKGEADFDLLISCASAGKSDDGTNNGVLYFTTEDYSVAREILTELLEISRIWPIEAERLYEESLTRVKRVRNYLLLDMKHTEPKYLGYISTRLKDRYGVPTVVLGRKKGDQVMAEVRTPRGVDSLELLNHLSHIFIDYGGHTQASGFCMNESALPELVEDLEAYFKGVDTKPHTDFQDLVIEGPDESILEDINRLAGAGLYLRMILKGLTAEHPLIGKLYDPSNLTRRQKPGRPLDIYVSSNSQGLRIQNIFEGSL